MTSLIDELAPAIVKFDLGDTVFLRAKVEYDLYDFKYKEPNILIRRKDDQKRRYTTRLTYQDTDMLAKCTCPSFVQKGTRPCKHCYISALNFIGKYIHEHPWENFSEAFKAILLDDYETLKDCPGINKLQIRGAYFHVKDRIPKKSEPAPEEENDWETSPREESHQQFKDEVKDIVTKPETLPAVKATKAFGGTVRDIPKNLVITLGGKPYVTKAGLIYAASQMGLTGIKTEPIHWSWEKDDGGSVFKATVTFKDGKEFSAYGIAIPDGKNIKMEQMYPFVDHLAETRAVGRALRNAMAFREPSVEEMSDYEARKQ